MLTPYVHAARAARAISTIENIIIITRAKHTTPDTTPVYAYACQVCLAPLMPRDTLVWRLSPALILPRFTTKHTNARMPYHFIFAHAVIYAHTPAPKTRINIRRLLSRLRLHYAAPIGRDHTPLRHIHHAPRRHHHCLQHKHHAMPRLHAIIFACRLNRRHYY